MPYEQDLPYAPHSHTSYRGAVSAAPRRGRQTARYLALVTMRPCADFEAALSLDLPLSSICSIRNGVKDQLVKAGTTTSPYGNQVDRWRVSNAL